MLINSQGDAWAEQMIDRLQTDERTPNKVENKPFVTIAFRF